MRSILLVCLMAAYVLTLAACGAGLNTSGALPRKVSDTPEPSVSSSTGTTEITGTIVYLNLEGGVYVIRGDDGQTYNPSNLPEKYQKDGLTVSVIARTKTDAIGIHMVGPIIEIVDISAR